MPEILEGLTLLEIKTFNDHRGYFRETYSQKRFNKTVGRAVEFVQDNVSLSKRRGTLRGLHFQKAPHVQAKLVSVSFGSIFDVAVDLRPNSPSFKQWRAFELSAENGRQLFVSEGFAHGFCTLSDDTVVNYKVSDFYAPECDGGIKWNDPDLDISWPFEEELMIVSDKDGALPFLSQLESVGW